MNHIHRAWLETQTRLQPLPTLRTPMDWSGAVTSPTPEMNRAKDTITETLKRRRALREQSK